MPLALPILAAFLLDRRVWVAAYAGFVALCFSGLPELVGGLAYGRWDVAAGGGLHFAGVCWVVRRTWRKS